MTHNEQRVSASVLAESNTITPLDIFKIVYVISNRDVELVLQVHAKLRSLYVPVLSASEIDCQCKRLSMIPPIARQSLSPSAILEVDHISSKHLDTLVNTLINNNDPVLGLLTYLVVCERNRINKRKPSVGESNAR